MIRSLFALTLATLAVSAAAQSAPDGPPDTAAAKAGAFSLDLPAPEAEPTPAPTADATPAADATPVSDAEFSIDVPIETLIANYRSKAVLDRSMPGLTVDKNLDKFRKLTLRKLAPLSDGRLDPALLARVQKELTAIE